MSSRITRARSALRRRIERGGSSDRGTLSVFVALAMVGMIALIGIVIDAGGLLDATVAADEYANEAARAGTQVINVDDAMTGKSITVYCPSTQPRGTLTAQSEAASFLKSAGVAATAHVTCPADQPNTVDVSFSTQYHTMLLSVFGIDSFTINGSGTATLVTGRQTPNGGQQ
jgi:Flp pilus assembly protein TadG